MLLSELCAKCMYVNTPENEPLLRHHFENNILRSARRRDICHGSHLISVHFPRSQFISALSFRFSGFLGFRECDDVWVLFSPSPQHPTPNAHPSSRWHVILKIRRKKNRRKWGQFWIESHEIEWFSERNETKRNETKGKGRVCNWALVLASRTLFAQYLH